MPELIETLVAEAKSVLEQHYGNRLDRLVVFGSQARGDAQPDSDLDLLAVLRDEHVVGSREIAALAPLLSRLSLKHNRTVSVLPVSVQRFTEAELPFYENVRREGIAA